jgi:hypothetical protein
VQRASIERSTCDRLPRAECNAVRWLQCCSALHFWQPFRQQYRATPGTLHCSTERWCSMASLLSFSKCKLIPRSVRFPPSIVLLYVFSHTYVQTPRATVTYYSERCSDTSTVTCLRWQILLIPIKMLVITSICISGKI